jgi:hypothetical protein
VRPDEELAILQVARQVNPARFGATYDNMRRSSFGMQAPLLLESLDEHGSYFKFNLDAVTFYSLIRQEEPGSPKLQEYLDAYAIFRNTTKGHGNASSMWWIEPCADLTGCAIPKQWICWPPGFRGRGAISLWTCAAR